MTQSSNNCSPTSGFELLLQRKQALNHWSVLSKLSSFAQNREATAIVQSFQIQMEIELHQVAPNRLDAA